MSEETTTMELYRDGTQPVVSADGSRLLPRRPGRELFPASWIRCQATLSYHDGDKAHDLRCTLLDFCGVGLLVTANGGGKKLVSWDRLVSCELED